MTNVESMFLYADNPLSLFLDKLVNETTTPPSGKSNEDHSKNRFQSIKVSTL